MKRYSKQVLVNEIGLLGQEKIRNSRVLVVGAGGLGTSLATTLAGMGVGCIGIVDFDEVELTNLHRQFTYTENDLGKKKVKVLAEFLTGRNPECSVEVYEEALLSGRSEEILRRYDVICDCTDNLTARILLDETAFKLLKPLVYAAVKDWEGYVTVLNYKKGARLVHVFPSITDSVEEIGSCAVSGIIPSTCGIIANIQAAEVLKIILSLSLLLDGAICCVNSLTNVTRIFKLNLP